MTEATPRGEQFLFLPSSNLGMGGLDIATNDSLGDPFRNPAVRASRPFLISLTPTAYGDKGETVRGRSLPLSAAFSGARWFGTIAVAVQVLEDDPKEVFALPSSLEGEVEEEDGQNLYVLGSVGRQIGDRTSIGLKVAYADLGLLDGVRRLYPAAVAVSQAGHIRTVTLGAVHALGNRHVVRATLSNSNSTLSQDVKGWHANPSEIPGVWLDPELWTRTDDSRSKVWQGSVRYTLSIPSERVRLTAMASLRKRDQGRTPQYDLVHVPHDPGTSTMGEIGFGWEAIGPLFRLAAEGAFAPGKAHTRLVSDTIVQRRDGTPIQPGDPTYETDFRFRNWQVAGGADVPIGSGGFQLGLRFLRYSFRLEQRDHVREEDHKRNVSWMEWVPSLGVRMTLKGVQMRYSLRLVNKGTAPCDPYSYRSSCRTMPVSYYVSGLRVAPTLPDDLPDFRMTSHQLTVTVPLG